MNTILKLFGAVVLGFALASSPAKAQSPEVLPSIEGNLTYPIDINNQGQIVGVTYNQNFDIQAVRWTATEVVPLVGFPYSYVGAINDAGVIVGAGFQERSGPSVPVVWVDGVASVLPNPGLGGAATDINSAGEIVGWVNTDLFTAPAVWRDGVLTILPGLFERGGEAVSIDDSGRISGISNGEEPGDRVPTHWTGDLPAGLPVTFGDDYIGVLGINKSGAGQTSGFLIRQQFAEDVGQYLIQVAVGWRNGEFRELQRPYGRGNSIANGVNGTGMFFGSTEDLEGYTIPTFWDNDGAVRLPLEAERSATAVAANESGLIIGFDRTDGRNPIPLLWRMDEIERIEMPNVQTTAGASARLTATVTKGNLPVANRTVEFRVRGRRIGVVTTDEAGVARIRYQVPINAAGRLDLMCSMGGSSYVFRSIVVGPSSVTAGVAAVRAKRRQTVRLVGTLRTAELNRPLAGRSVEFVLRGKVIARGTTNARGTAVAQYIVPANMSISRFPLEVRYAGDAATKQARGRATLRLLR